MFVDLKIVKEKVPINEVLRHCDLLDEMRPKSNQLIGRCPFEGRDERVMCGESRDNVWFCFSCKRGGDNLNFVSIKERVTPQQAGELVAK